MGKQSLHSCTCTPGSGHCCIFWIARHSGLGLLIECKQKNGNETTSPNTRVSMSSLFHLILCIFNPFVPAMPYTAWNLPAVKAGHAVYGMKQFWSWRSLNMACDNWRSVYGNSFSVSITWTHILLPERASVALTMLLPKHLDVQQLRLDWQQIMRTIIIFDNKWFRHNLHF